METETKQVRHTPGEWSMRSNFANDQIFMVESSKRSHPIATVRYEGDANLFVAAPDLLAACKELVRAKDQPVGHVEQSLTKAMELAVNAIAKAEQRSAR